MRATKIEENNPSPDAAHKSQPYSHFHDEESANPNEQSKNKGFGDRIKQKSVGVIANARKIIVKPVEKSELFRATKIEFKN